MPPTDERFTPPGVIHLRDAVWRTTTTDPCWNPRSFSRAVVTYTKDDDGSIQIWFGRVWLNPPWSEPGPWIELLIAHVAGQSKLGSEPLREGMAMVRNDPSTSWWRLAWETADAVVFLAERTRYYQLVDGEVVPCGTPEFSSVIFYWGHDAESFLREFESAGHYGRELPSYEKRIRMNHETKSLEERLSDVLRDEVITIIGNNLDMTLDEVREETVSHLPDEHHVGIYAVFANLSVGDLCRCLSHQADATDVAVIPPAKKASNPAKKVPKPKKAPAKPKKAPAKPAKKPRLSASQEDTSDAAANGPEQTTLKKTRTSVSDRCGEVVEWMRAEGLEEFKAADVMAKFSISRQTATRVLQQIPSVSKAGEGAGSHYVVSPA